jgi:hypothetical protein
LLYGSNSELLEKLEADGTAREHCYRQHQHYRIERAIQKAKSDI